MSWNGENAIIETMQHQCYMWYNQESCILCQIDHVDLSHNKMLCIVKLKLQWSCHSWARCNIKINGDNDFIKRCVREFCHLECKLCTCNNMGVDMICNVGGLDDHCA